MFRINSTVRNPKGIATSGLASFPFARRYLENRFFFLFLRLLRCFSSAGLPPYGYVFTAQYLGIAQVGSPIRKSTDQYLFTVPRSLSQLIASFFGSWCQGIRPVPFVAWSLVLSIRKLYESLLLTLLRKNSFFLSCRCLVFKVLLSASLKTLLFLQ